MSKEILISRVPYSPKAKRVNVKIYVINFDVCILNGVKR